MLNKLGCLVVDIEGKELSAEDRDIINHPLVGGVILFSRNYESREQIKSLTASIRAARKSPLLIMVDQEGGRVQRFINGFTRLPPAGSFGQIFDNDPAQGLELARSGGFLMANEILSVGIDFSIAPVLDLNACENKAIGNRAFHATPEGVTQLAHAYIQGMHDAGMASVGKHFPGHGSVSIDSHLDIPVDNRSYDEIKRKDLVPFAKLIKNGLKSILASHIIFPQIDKVVAGYSHIWLNKILRDELKFAGPILSDDLNMAGANISANYADRVTASREAGCDFALVCNNRRGVIEVVDELAAESNSVTPDKWKVLAGNFNINASISAEKKADLTKQINTITERA